MAFATFLIWRLGIGAYDFLALSNASLADVKIKRGYYVFW